MAHLIDKSALVEEIGRLKAEALQKKSQCKRSGLERMMHQIGAYNKILSFLDTIRVKEIGADLGDTKGDKNAKYIIDTKTLEVKEVDLEKHLKEDIEDVLFDLDGVAVKSATHYLTVEDIKDIAKHFFELGIAASNKAQKGE